MKLREYLESIIYKPNFTIIVSETDYGLMLKVKQVVQDVDNPNDKVVKTHTYGFDKIYTYTEDEVKEHLRILFTSIEMHEMFEWLKVGGKRLYNPHE